MAPILNKTIFVVPNVDPIYRDFIWKAFATEALWRAEHDRLVNSTTDPEYPNMGISGDIQECAVSEREYNRIVKTGLLWATYQGYKNEPRITIVASASRTGLVRHARDKWGPEYTAYELFEQTPSGVGLFLLDGYAVPPQYTRQDGSQSNLNF